MSDHIISQLDDGILTISIERATKKNALTRAMYKQLGQAILDARQNKKCRVIIITGTEDIFCAGNDIQDFLAHSNVEGDANPAALFMENLLDCEKPVIAAVNGAAIGIGATMLLHCDFVIAADQAHFKMPFVDLALVPEFASSFILPRMIGHQKAAEFLLLGDSFTPDEGKDWGLIYAVYPADILMSEVHKLATKLANKPAAALRHSKTLMRQHQQSETKAQMVAELKMFDKALKSPEAIEAFTAFMEKRARNFRQFD